MQQPRTSSPHHRVALVIVGFVVLFVVVLVPFAVSSVVANVISPQSHHVFALTAIEPAAASMTYANVDLVAMDEWAGTVSLRVTGQHLCGGGCSWNDSILFLSIPDSYAEGQGLPPAQEVVVNSGALVLGIWGIRAILLGTNVPGFTAVDLALAVVILFLLAAMTIRTLLYLWMRVLKQSADNEQQPPKH